VEKIAPKLTDTTIVMSCSAMLSVMWSFISPKWLKNIEKTHSFIKSNIHWHFDITFSICIFFFS
jgi:hypothetical protein